MDRLLEQGVLVTPSLFIPKANRLYLGMQELKAPYLQEKLERTGDITESSIYKVAFDEFKKYAALSVSTDKPLGMTSPEVDSVWHQFILFTQQYRSFCDDNLEGTFLHHNPYVTDIGTKMAGIHASNLQKAYESTFGEAPDLWRGFQTSTDPCDGCSQSDGGCSSE